MVPMKTGDKNWWRFSHPNFHKMVVVFQSDRAGNDSTVFSYQNNPGEMIDVQGHCGIQSKQIRLPCFTRSKDRSIITYPKTSAALELARTKCLCLDAHNGVIHHILRWLQNLYKIAVICKYNVVERSYFWAFYFRVVCSLFTRRQIRLQAF